MYQYHSNGEHTNKLEKEYVNTKMIKDFLG